MYLDILSRNRYLTINLRLAKLFNLKTSILVAVLIDRTDAALQVGALNDQGYLKLDADSISEQTTLTTDDIYEAITNLQNAGLVLFDADTNMLRVMPDRITAIITGASQEEIEKVVADTVKSKEDKAKAKEQGIKFGLKKGLKETPELNEALSNWIDMVFNTRPLNKSQLALFIKEVKAAYSDPDAQVKIVNIATLKGYTTPHWAIEQYKKEQDKNVYNRLPVASRLNKEQKIATDVSQLGKSTF